MDADTDWGVWIWDIAYLATFSSLAVREVECVNCFRNCAAGGGTGASDHPEWPECKVSPHLLVIKPLWAADSDQTRPNTQERSPAAF